VFDNVAFALQIERLPVHQIQRRVEEVLELVGLPGFGPRDVNTLSGGEQQRVALARSLAPRPRLLMLDEPLGSLDRNLRERLVIDLREILRGSRQTAIYVTHDQEEAFTLAHRVVVMNAGKVEQIAPPQEIYRRPASVFVARFLGLNNLFTGEIRPGERQADTPIGRLPVNGDLHGKVTVLLRPDMVSLDGQGDCRLHGVLAQATFRGGVSRAVITVDGHPLTFDFPSTVVLPQPGEPVTLTFDAEAVQVFPDSEQVI
jgi:ABC-type Fe3+/spermidine/putrescine transport system ATPase subunit